MITLYGIKNCDTVKKARRWLDDNQISYHFHDFRTDGLTETQIQHWLQSIPLDTLLNKRSTSWRQLTEQQKSLTERDALIALMLEIPTLIKRPVLAKPQHVLVGFSADTYQQFTNE